MKNVTLNVHFVDLSFLSTTWEIKIKTPQSTNAAHKSLRQVQFSAGWEPGDEVLFLPINKMACWFIFNGYTQICVARGIVSCGSNDNDATGELRLWYCESDSDYRLTASSTVGHDIVVCKVVDVSSLPKVHWQKSKFQYWKQIVPCESGLIKGFQLFILNPFYSKN